MKIIEIKNPPTVEALIESFGRRPFCFILDSAQSNDGLGEWSFFGSDPYKKVSGDLSDLRRSMFEYTSPVHPVIPFTGGAVGYLSYDYGRRLEEIPTICLDDRSIPDMQFNLYDGVAAFNHYSGVLYLVGHNFHVDADIVLERIRAIVEDTSDVSATNPVRSEWSWNLSKQEFFTAVERVRDYIASGDVYQVNLSRRARCSFEGDPIRLYCALRRGNPAPYCAYMDLNDWQIISTSPEQFLRKRGRNLETRPIKGTCPRGANKEADYRQEAVLRSSEKDRAELLMIVDLERNDLGRVAEFGSVRVEGLYKLEHYARVIHQTARVHAKLTAGKDIYDTLAALFPGGSITGAPKIRAMEIIEELEPNRRGVYCGSIGYIGFDGDADFNIAIRSLHLKDGYLDYQAGGGIVWDSIPEAEYQETLDKALAIRESIDQLCHTSL